MTGANNGTPVQMENLFEESLKKVIEKISKSNKLISIKPTKLILPQNVIDYLADLGYDSQEKINELIIELTKDQS